MKRKLLWIISALVVCVLCVVAIIILGSKSESTHSSESPADSQTQSTSQSFHNNDMLASREDIKTVKITSAGESFTVNAGDDSKDPSLAELDGIKQNIQLENALLALCKSLRGQKLVEDNASDLAKYGLQPPKGEAEITYKDGSTAKILVGDASPSDERKCYAAVAGQKKVWLVEDSAAIYFTGKAKDYVSQVMSPAAERTAANTAQMTITKNGAQDIQLERNGESWAMTSPIKAHLDEEKSSGTVNGLYGLNAEYCEVVRPDDAAKATCGLDKPAVTVKLTEGDTVITLKIGSAVVRKDESEKERYYCLIEGSADTNCIYAVAKQYLPWIDATAATLVSEIIFPNYLVNLRSIDITVNGKKSEYLITNEGGDNTKINEDISKMRTASVKSAGRDIDLQKFRELYEHLMKCPSGKLFTNDIKGDAYITAVYHKNDGTADKLELVKTTDGLGAKVNGQMSYLVDNAWADKLITMINAL